MSLKLVLIASLATVSVAGLSTGGYFLLKNGSKNVEDSKKEEQGSNKVPATSQTESPTVKPA